MATINGLSSHAGQSELVQWFDTLAAARPHLILAHGEEKSRMALAHILQQRCGVESILPDYGETISL